MPILHVFLYVVVINGAKRAALHGAGDLVPRLRLPVGEPYVLGQFVRTAVDGTTLLTAELLIWGRGGGTVGHAVSRLAMR